MDFISLGIMLGLIEIVFIIGYIAGENHYLLDAVLAIVGGILNLMAGSLFAFSSPEGLPATVLVVVTTLTCAVLMLTESIILVTKLS